MLSAFLFITSVCLVDLDKGYGPSGPGSYLPGGRAIAGNSGATLQTLARWTESSGPCFSGNILVPSVPSGAASHPLAIPSAAAQPASHFPWLCSTHSLLSPVGENVGSVQNVLEDEWHCPSTTEKSRWPAFCTLYINICLSYVWRLHTQHGKEGRSVGDLFGDTQRRQPPCGGEPTLVNQCVMQDLRSGPGPSCPLLTILSF